MFSIDKDIDLVCGSSFLFNRLFNKCNNFSIELGGDYDSGSDEHEDYTEEEEYGGFNIGLQGHSRRSTIYNIIYKRPIFIRNRTKNQMHVVLDKGTVTMGMIYIANNLPLDDNLDGMTQYINGLESIVLYCAPDNNSCAFEPKSKSEIKKDRTYFSRNEKLMAVTFTVKANKLMMIDTGKHDESGVYADKDFDDNMCVIQYVNGFYFGYTKTKNVKIDKFYKITDDNKLKEIKKYSELVSTEKEKTKEDINIMFKNLFSHLTKLNLE